MRPAEFTTVGQASNAIEKERGEKEKKGGKKEEEKKKKKRTSTTIDRRHIHITRDTATEI